MISVMLYFVHFQRIFIPQSNKEYLEKKTTKNKAFAFHLREKCFESCICATQVNN